MGRTYCFANPNTRVYGASNTNLLKPQLSLSEMAKIVALHGIGQQFSGANELKRFWFPSIKDGLERAHYTGSLSSEDFDVVFYGDIFRPRGERLESIPYISEDEMTNEEKHLLFCFWEEAARLSHSSEQSESDEASDIFGPDKLEEARSRWPKTIQNALTQLSKSKFFLGISPSLTKRMLLFTLRQVRLFLHNENNIKTAILKRVSEKIQSDTSILIGHSLGSIVGYEWLCKNSEGINTFISVGSPLGIRGLIFDVLTPRPIGGIGEWPKVKSWVNVADQGDIVAMEKNLAARFGDDVIDKLVYNGWKSHDFINYANTDVFGTIIAQALSTN